jgi:hypothetical protein
MGKRSRHFRFTKKKSREEVERESNRAMAASLLSKMQDINALKEMNDGQADRTR